MSFFLEILHLFSFLISQKDYEMSESDIADAFQDYPGDGIEWFDDYLV